jgi:hypothetical protein
MTPEATTMTAQRRTSVLLAAIGYVLSPLSWWNDLFVNLPLAWLLAQPFGWISERLFLPAMLLAYWMTNAAGLVLLHVSLARLRGRKRPCSADGGVCSALVLTTVYSTLVIVAWLRGWLPGP